MLYVNLVFYGKSMTSINEINSRPSHEQNTPVTATHEDSANKPISTSSIEFYWTMIANFARQVSETPEREDTKEFCILKARVAIQYRDFSAAMSALEKTQNFEPEDQEIFLRFAQCTWVYSKTRY